MKLSFTTKTGRATAGPWNLVFLFSDLLCDAFLKQSHRPENLYFPGTLKLFWRGDRRSLFSVKEMKPPPISAGMVRMYFCKVIPSRIDTRCIFNVSARKKHIIWVLQGLHLGKSMAQVPPTSMLQVKATIPQDSSLEINPKNPRKVWMNYKELSLPSPLSR